MMVLCQFHSTFHPMFLLQYLLLDLMSDWLLRKSLLVSLLSVQVSSWQHIQMILFPIKTSVLEPETCSTDKGEDCHRAVIPNKERVCRERDESLTESCRDGGHEEVEGHDERSHVLWCFGEGVFQGRDGRKNFRDGDQDIGTCLGPDIDVDWWAHLFAVSAEGSWEDACSSCATNGLLVDVSLDDGCPDHSCGTGVKPHRDFLDGCEADIHFSEEGPEYQIAKWDEDDECKWIEVGEDIVGETVKRHYCGLRSEIVVQLVVGEPVEGNPAKDGAGREASSDFVNPLVVECHPSWATGGLNVGWLDVFPECTVVEPFVRLDWVE